MSTSQNKLTVAVALLDKLLNEKIVVGCVTCNTFFLNMKWKDYLPLIHGDFQTPTKWYNKAVLHFCENPTHEILSSRSQTGLNQSFDFSTSLRDSCSRAGLPLSDLLKVAKEMEQKVENQPI